MLLVARGATARRVTRVKADDVEDRFQLVSGSRMDLLARDQPISHVQAVGGHRLHLGAAGAAAETVVQQHHQHVFAKVEPAG